MPSVRLNGQHWLGAFAAAEHHQQIRDQLIAISSIEVEPGIVELRHRIANDMHLSLIHI